MSAMRRAQRIVALEGEVVLRALELLDARERFDGADGGEALRAATAYLETVEHALLNKLAALRDELEQLGAPPAPERDHSLRVTS